MKQQYLKMHIQHKICKSDYTKFNQYTLCTVVLVYLSGVSESRDYALCIKFKFLSLIQYLQSVSTLHTYKIHSMNLINRTYISKYASLTLGVSHKK